MFDFRIVSQDGGTDLPYNQSIISFFYENSEVIITAITPECVTSGEDYWTIAKYDSKEKAAHALISLRKAYTNWVDDHYRNPNATFYDEPYFYFPKND